MVGEFEYIIYKKSLFSFLSAMVKVTSKLNSSAWIQPSTYFILAT